VFLPTSKPFEEITKNNQVWDNHEHSHEALGRKCPDEVYQPSSRAPLKK